MPPRCPFFFFFKSVYFWLHWVFVGARICSLIVQSGGYCRVAVLKLGAAVAPPAAERRLQSAGSVVGARGLCCPEACGVFPDQGSNPHPLHGQADS